MSDYFLGEIRVFTTTWPPKGWMVCSGQTLPIAQYSALFALLGTTYGGDGIHNFKLPDLRGRAIVGVSTAPGGGDFQQGMQTGTETVTVTSAEMPAHNHGFVVTTDMAEAASPNGHYLGMAKDSLAPGGGNPVNVYAPPSSSLQPLASTTIGSSGGSQPHQNMQPYTTLNYCIATQGIFPSRS